MKPNEKISISYMIILSVLCIFILSIFVSTYIYITKVSSNSYENNLKAYINAINKANMSTATLIKEGNLDTQTARSSLPSIISSLQKSKDKVIALNPTDKLKFYQDSLIQGLTNNINIYTQILNVLNNPESMDISSSRNNVKKFKEVCIDCYSQVAISKIKIGLQKNTIDFIDGSIYYVDQLVKIKKNQSISDSQNTDFIKGIDETFKNFQIIKTDFKAYLYSLRNNNDNYDELINLISKNKTNLTNLKVDFTKISVPQKSQVTNPIVVFDTLKNTINDYGLYLDSFTYALANEKVQASNVNIDKNLIDKLYTEADLKMSTVTKDYNDFIQTYNDFKDIK